MSICKRLATAFGGNWNYQWPCYWNCDDGHRYVVRTHSGGYDLNGEAMPGYTEFLYDRRTPKVPGVDVNEVTRHGQKKLEFSADLSDIIKPASGESNG